MAKNFFFENRTTAQTIAKNTFWLLAGEAISRIVRVLIVIFAASVLGVAGFGTFSFAMAIANFAAIFSDLGATSIVGREVSRNAAEQSRYFSNALVYKGALLMFNVAIILFIIPQIVNIPEVLPLLPLIALLLIFDTLRDFVMTFFRALERMEWDALVKILTNITIAGLGLYMLKSAGTVLAFTNAYVLGTIFGFIIGAIILFSYSRNWFAPIQKSLIKSIAVSAWPMGLLTLAGTLSINTDMVMLGWMTTPTAVGLYAAAQKPILLLYVIPNLIASAMFPVMARLAHGAHDKMKGIMERGVRTTLLLALPITVGGIIVAPQLITSRFLYGPNFAGATSSFQILLLTILISFPFAVINNAILAQNKQIYFVRFFVIGAIVNISLNALLIPRFGIVGASVATVFAQLVSNWLTFRAIRKSFPISFKIGLSRITLATAAMAIFALFCTQNGISLLISVPSSMLVFVGTLLLLREPLLKDLRSIMKPSPTETS